MDDLSVIDRFTDTFSRYIDSGFGLVSGDVAYLTSVLVALDVTLAGLFWALRGDDNVVAQLIRKTLYGLAPVSWSGLILGSCAAE